MDVWGAWGKLSLARARMEGNRGGRLTILWCPAQRAPGEPADSPRRPFSCILSRLRVLWERVLCCNSFREPADCCRAVGVLICRRGSQERQAVAIANGGAGGATPPPHQRSPNSMRTIRSLARQLCGSVSVSTLFPDITRIEIKIQVLRLALVFHTIPQGIDSNTTEEVLSLGEPLPWPKRSSKQGSDV